MGSLPTFHLLGKERFSWFGSEVLNWSMEGRPCGSWLLFLTDDYSRQKLAIFVSTPAGRYECVHFRSAIIPNPPTETEQPKNLTESPTLWSQPACDSRDMNKQRENRTLPGKS